MSFFLTLPRSTVLIGLLVDLFDLIETFPTNKHSVCQVVVSTPIWRCAKNAV